MRDRRASPIAGSGGKGKKRHVPVEAADNLFAHQYATVLDLVSEGEIAGLVNGARSIYLDGQPLMDANGTYNFGGNDAVWAEKKGTAAQTPMESTAIKVNAIETAIYAPSNPTELKQGEAHKIQQQVDDADNLIESVKVTVYIPVLSYLNKSSGDLGGNSVQFSIYGQGYNETGWTLWKQVTVSGKTTTGISRDYVVAAPGANTPFWQVKIVRDSPDDMGTASNSQRQTFISRIATLINHKLRYPHSAYIGLRLDAAYFQSIPERAYHLRGLLIRVPTNYDPVTRAYTGLWDGTFKVAWSDNPAWCFYDLATMNRYGLGDIVDPSLTNQWNLYPIAQYCDGLVPSGMFSGGNPILEPRMTCNLYLQTREEAFKVLTDMAGIFRGMIWWGAGQICATQDRPIDPTRLITNANVIDGEFGYAGSSLGTRHTVAIVAWNDPTDMSRPKPERVEDFEGILQRGAIEDEIVAFGCHSRGQAHRLGRWKLLTERLETETVTFRLGVEGGLVLPGEIVRIRDADALTVRQGGRLLAMDGLTAILDASVTLEAGASYYLNVVLADGTVGRQAVTSGAGTHSALTVFEGFLPAPNPYAIWTLEEAGAADQWRVVTVTEEEDTGYFAVLALAYRPEKFAQIDAELAFDADGIWNPADPGAVTAIHGEWLHYTDNNGQVQNKAHFFWSEPTAAAWYSIEWAVQAEGDTAYDNPVRLESRIPGFEITPANKGNYKVTVIAYSAIGSAAPAHTEVIALPNGGGGSGSVPDVAALTCTRSGSLGVAMAFLAWSKVTPSAGSPPISHYELRALDVASDPTPTWSEATLLSKVTANALADAIGYVSYVDWVEGAYFVKAVNTAGIESANAASALTVNLIPPDVTGFSLQSTGASAVLKWDALPTADLDHYEIRFQAVTSAAAWETAAKKADIAAPGTTCTLPLEIGTYLIKAVDKGGAYSANAASAVNTTPAEDTKSVLNGSGAPDPTLGKLGDFYIDTASYQIYGPKTAGGWGSPTSLVGPPGSGGGSAGLAFAESLAHTGVVPRLIGSAKLAAGTYAVVEAEIGCSDPAYAATLTIQTQAGVLLATVGGLAGGLAWRSDASGLVLAQDSYLDFYLSSNDSKATAIFAGMRIF